MEFSFTAICRSTSVDVLLTTLTLWPLSLVQDPSFILAGLIPSTLQSWASAFVWTFLLFGAKSFASGVPSLSLSGSGVGVGVSVGLAVAVAVSVPLLASSSL